MTAWSPISLPAASPNPWADLRAQADTEDDQLWDSLLSGRHDAERLGNSSAALTAIAALPPLDPPDPVILRHQADAAAARLIVDLLSG